MLNVDLPSGARLVAQRAATARQRRRAFGWASIGRSNGGEMRAEVESDGRRGEVLSSGSAAFGP